MNLISTIQILFLLLTAVESHRCKDGIANATRRKPFFRRWWQSQTSEDTVASGNDEGRDMNIIPASSMHSFTGVEGMDHISHLEDYPSISRRGGMNAVHDDSNHKKILHSSGMHSFTGVEGMHGIPSMVTATTEVPEEVIITKPKRRNLDRPHTKHTHHVKFEREEVQKEHPSKYK